MKSQNHDLLLFQEKEELKHKIRCAFNNAEFPHHCGWNAAISMDDWITDPKELINITKLKDTKGEWWEIPFESMVNCSLAQCYLDAKGVEFYLPAFMTGVVDNTTRKNYCNLISWLTPRKNEQDCCLYDYFCERFSFLNTKQKKVCIEVLVYIRNNLDPLDHNSHAEINQILHHEFWQHAN